MEVEKLISMNLYFILKIKNHQQQILIQRQLSKKYPKEVSQKIASKRKQKMAWSDSVIVKGLGIVQKTND
ncbi:unnamed protein product [Paramecium octaurelia]|uniref:Uncharacterized protein n=1 Tax=Paramecium octaurelia TaxID=43137 RepID=A0A8S1UXW4_PAROT|nr:unnamed protein product [Paramecium octaurelia]